MDAITLSRKGLEIRAHKARKRESTAMRYVNGKIMDTRVRGYDGERRMCIEPGTRRLWDDETLGVI